MAMPVSLVSHRGVVEGTSLPNVTLVERPHVETELRSFTDQLQELSHEFTSQLQSLTNPVRPSSAPPIATTDLQGRREATANTLNPWAA